uniref:Uncharacterized protein n=1 Tax=Tetranychus urticae TaxID=32264 RepID=T1L4W9_TETUR
MTPFTPFVFGASSTTSSLDGLIFRKILKKWVKGYKRG